MRQFEEAFYYDKKPWVIALYTVLVVLAYCFIDKPLATHLHDLDIRNKLYVLSLFTVLGESSLYLALFFISALFFRYWKRNPSYEAKSWYLFACVLLPTLLCVVLKIMLGRARPDLLFSDNLFGFYGFHLKKLYWSFPSGHSVAVAAVAAGIGVIYRRYFFAIMGLALMVTLSRVILYRHYLSDVMTGFYLGLLVVGLLTEYFKRKQLLAKAWTK